MSGLSFHNSGIGGVTAAGEIRNGGNGHDGLAGLIPSHDQITDFGLAALVNNQVLFGGEKGVEKGAGNANCLVDLLHGGVLDALSGHQIQCSGDERGANPFPVHVGTSNLWYVRAPSIKSFLKFNLYSVSSSGKKQGAA